MQLGRDPVKEKGQSLKISYYIVAIKEHIRVFLLGLACKKMHCGVGEGI
jgi:hypothetical protein